MQNAAIITATCRADSTRLCTTTATVTSRNSGIITIDAYAV